MRVTYEFEAVGEGFSDGKTRPKEYKVVSYVDYKNYEDAWNGMLSMQSAVEKEAKQSISWYYQKVDEKESFDDEFED